MSESVNLTGNVKVVIKDPPTSSSWFSDQTWIFSLFNQTAIESVDGTAELAATSTSPISLPPSVNREIPQSLSPSPRARPLILPGSQSNLPPPAHLISRLQLGLTSNHQDFVTRFVLSSIYISFDTILLVVTTM